MSFLNFRIRGRLYLGFGALLLFCAALAGFAVLQLTEIRHQVGLMSLQSKNAIRVGEITTELQAVRRAILRYTFDQDEASAAESEKRLAKISGLLEHAIGTTKSDERRAAYKEVEKDVIEL
jgi:Four helix bundle sensory module for signal transduction